MARIVSSVLGLDELTPLPPPARLAVPRWAEAPLQRLNSLPRVLWLGLVVLLLWSFLPLGVFALVSFAAWEALWPTPAAMRRRDRRRRLGAGGAWHYPALVGDEPGRKALAAETAVIRRLAALPDSHIVLHNLVLPGGADARQADLVVVTPHGLWCLEVKPWVGRIYGQEDEPFWTQVKEYGLDAMKDRRENPVARNAEHCRALSRHLAASGRVLHVASAVVFTEADLHTNTTTPTVSPAGLKSLLAAHPSPTLLTPEEVTALGNQLRELVSATPVTSNDAAEPADVAPLAEPPAAMRPLRASR